MMKKLIVSLFVFLFSFTTFAKDVAGINIDDKITLANTTLSLNGAGVRSMFFIDLYVGGLYLKQKCTNAKKIIFAKTPMDIRMIIISSLITPSKMKDGFNDDFVKIEKLGYKTDKNSLQKFLSSFKDKINKKDVFDFFYQPPCSVYIYKNGKNITKIDDFEFKKALFAIWLSKKPAQKSLKEKMLGK